MTFDVRNLTEIEFSNHFPVFATPQASACQEWKMNVEAPTQWDWREASKVSKVQNQGAMGSSAKGSK